jgi:two-component system OmpR family sensor kinase
MTTRARQHTADLACEPRQVLAEAPAAPDLIRQAAHDLRQPVAAILALVSAAAIEPHAPDQVRRRLGQIAEQASWMSKIIRDLLLVQDGSEVVDVCALVRDAVAAERLIYPGSIELHQANGEPRYVVGTPVRLRRALANVLSNATRAAGKDGRVELTQQPGRDAELLEIVDDGPGFGKVAQGHGIGLRVTRQMLAECGGWLEHEQLPAGRTLVRLFLPTASAGHGAGAQ